MLQGIDLWSQRAEIATIHEELPWTDLLGGIMSPDDILDRDKVQLVDYMRAKGLQLFFTADLTDGLSRGEEAPRLLGLSSYPYFGFAQREDIPANYYSRLLNGRTLPVMVVEGGWTSAAAGTVQSSPALQARYVTRHAQLLNAVGARGLIQLVFADIDLASLPPPIPPNLPLFVNIGLTDSDFNAKPALAAWDALHARRLMP